MGKCKFCGQHAGIFRSIHDGCKIHNAVGKRSIIALVCRAVGQSASFLNSQIALIAQKHHIRNDELPILKLKGWEAAILREEKKADFYENTIDQLTGLAKRLSLSESDISTNVIWKRYLSRPRIQNREKLRIKTKLALEQAERERNRAKGEAVFDRDLEQHEAASQRNLQESEVERQRELQAEAERKHIKQQEQTERESEILADLIKRNVYWGFLIGTKGDSLVPYVHNGETPFNLLKSETLVWVFERTEYLQEQVIQRCQYYSRFETPTQYAMRLVDRGMLGVTTKHIYFVGDNESFRIRYDRIVAFKEYPDGAGLNRESEQARHQKFVTGEGWFTYNLFTTFARRFSRSD